MTPAEADARIMRSRQVHSAWAQAFAAGDLAAPRADYQRMIADEIAELRKIATEHPGKAEKIGNLIERYEVMSRHMGE